MVKAEHILIGVVALIGFGIVIYLARAAPPPPEGIEIIDVKLLEAS